METQILKKEVSLKTIYLDLVLPSLGLTAETDHRRHNISHGALDALKSGFAMFNLKSDSLFGFRPKTEMAMANLKSMFYIDKIPSDNGLRNILDKLDDKVLNQSFDKVIPYLKEHNILDEYRYWNDHLVVSIDGVQHQCSNKVKCEHCQVRKHSNGTETYHHSMLTAALVCPGQREVFVLKNEPILKQDGVEKNDCEQNASKRLFKELKYVNHEESIVYVLDALYACGPIIRCITEKSDKWKYLINAKEKGNKYLFEQFDKQNDAEELDWHERHAEDGEYDFAFINELSVNKSNEDVKVNFLFCNFKPKKGKEISFSWITNIELNSDNVMDVMRMARSRWKIENEVFNTLKNQEYNYGHNFGHGKKNLATNFAYLMMLAFTVDQILQRCSKQFQQICKKLKTKIKVWELYKAIFLTVPCSDIDDIYEKMLVLCGVQVT